MRGLHRKGGLWVDTAGYARGGGLHRQTNAPSGKGMAGDYPAGKSGIHALPACRTLSLSIWGSLDCPPAILQALHCSVPAVSYLFRRPSVHPVLVIKQAPFECLPIATESLVLHILCVKGSPKVCPWTGWPILGRPTEL